MTKRSKSKATTAAKAGPASIPAAHPPLAQWPPYGLVNETFMYDVRTRRVPVGFLVQGQPADDRGFTAWLEAVTDELAELLWPRYTGHAHAPWQGAAAAFAAALTLDDFALMKGLRGQVEQAPRGRDKALARTHLALFLDEDDKAPWPTYAEYETKLPAALMEALQATMQATNRNFGPAPLRFKALLQRPRPYQMALMLGQAGFRYDFGKSAVTASSISGHAVQGLIAGTGAFVRHLRELRSVAGARQHLQQYAVDVGDRRVFAGVHFPSDNLASWLVTARLCDQGFFGELVDEAKAFIAGAVLRSAVYQAMHAHGGHYTAALKRLEQALGEGWVRAAAEARAAQASAPG